MFDNVGNKIKSMALVMFVLETIGAIVGGIAAGEEIGFLGVCIIAGGIVVAYASALLLYGFGELIQSSAETRDLLKEGKAVPAEQRAVPQMKPSAPREKAPVCRPMEQPVPREKKSPIAEAVKPLSGADGQIVCPSCRTAQKANRRCCFICGQTFRVE